MRRPRATADDILQRLVGASLEQVCFGADGVQLGLSGDGHVALEGAVRLGKANAPEVPLAVLATRLVPLAQEQVTISSIAVDAAGTLMLAVGNLTLTCRSDPSYEAWNITSDKGGPVICLPGGELAVFA